MRLIAIALLLCTATAFGQENDWVETPIIEEIDWIFPPAPEPDPAPDPAPDPTPEPDWLIEERLQKIEDMAKQAMRQAEEATSLAKAASMSESRVREIAREEAIKVMATIRHDDGREEVVPADDLTPIWDEPTEKVRVAGYAGWFDVPKGSHIVSINGQPVRGMASAPETPPGLDSMAPVYSGQSRSYQIHGQQRGDRVRFFLAPRSCRIVNGVRICR